MAGDVPAERADQGLTASPVERTVHREDQTRAMPTVTQGPAGGVAAVGLATERRSGSWHRRAEGGRRAVSTDMNRATVPFHVALRIDRAILARHEIGRHRPPC